MSDTKIEWADKVWNPVTGCRPYSSGCANCYAQVQSHLRGANPQPAMQRKYHGLTVLNSHRRPTFTGEVRCHEEDLLAPMKVKRPTTWFVNSMSDLFYGDEADRRAAEKKGQPFTPVPFAFIDKVFAAMALCPQHTFQILTKRAERMAEYFRNGSIDVTEGGQGARCLDLGSDPFIKPLGLLLADLYASSEESRVVSPDQWPLPNVWLGVSVEDQKSADERIPHLLRVPAAVRFLSCEPLLGPIKFTRLHQFCPTHDFESGFCSSPCPDLRFVDWIIAGGESGRGARPAHPDWFRSLRDQCQAAGVPFFFKQWGDWQVEMESSGVLVCSGDGKSLRVIGADGKCGTKLNAPYALVRRVGKGKAGRLLDGLEWNEMPMSKLCS